MKRQDTMIQEQQRTNELRQRIETAFEQFRTAFVVKKFERNLSEDVPYPERLARVLSKKFQTLRVTVSFEAGSRTLSVSPRPFAWDNHYYNQSELDGLLDPEKAKAYWPDFDEVQAFVKGWVAGFDDARQMAKEEEDRFNSPYAMMMPPPWFFDRRHGW